MKETLKQKWIQNESSSHIILEELIKQRHKTYFHFTSWFSQYDDDRIYIYYNRCLKIFSKCSTICIEIAHF